MKKLSNKLKYYICGALAVLLLLERLFIKNNIVFTIVLAVMLIIFVTIDDGVKKETAEDVDPELEEELIADGEYTYDNYDEVCCPKCGAFLGKDVTSCSQCGYGKEEKEDIVCPQCGKVNEDGLDFCAYCNYDFK